MNSDFGISSFVLKDEITRDMEDSVIKECIINQRKAFSTSFPTNRMTECPRRLVYESLSYHKEDKYVKFTDNIACIKAKWIERLNRIKNLELVDKNVLASDCNYGITDTIDCIIRYKDDELFVTNIQPVSNDEFSIIKKKGALRKHIVTITIQMWLAEVKNGLLICENKDNNDFVMFHVKEYKSIIQSVQKKCRLMMEYKVKGFLPDRPYQKNSGAECEECEFSKECWKK
jgi:hypothetical protein